MNKFIFPIREQYRITQKYAETLLDYSQFGMKWHNGIDLACYRGTGVYAVAPGKVTLATKDYQPGTGGYGNNIGLLISSDRPNKYYDVIYGHLLTVYVKEGDEVEAGQLIGLVDSTGFSTGDHLHFGVRLVERRTPKDGEASRVYLGDTYVLVDYNNGCFGYIDPESLFITAPLREILAVDLRYGQPYSWFREKQWEVVHAKYAYEQAQKYSIPYDERLKKAFVYGYWDAFTNREKRQYGVFDPAYYFTAMTMPKPEFLKKIGKPSEGTDPFALLGLQ